MHHPYNTRFPWPFSSDSTTTKSHHQLPGFRQHTTLPLPYDPFVVPLYDVDAFHFLVSARISKIRAQVPCPERYYRSSEGATSQDDCALCVSGGYCLSGSIEPTECPRGFYCVTGEQGYCLTVAIYAAIRNNTGYFTRDTKSPPSHWDHQAAVPPRLIVPHALPWSVESSLSMVSMELVYAHHPAKMTHILTLSTCSFVHPGYRERHVSVAFQLAPFLLLVR